MFESRRIEPNHFVKVFLDSLLPGVIPREDFINWDRIENKYREYQSILSFYATLRTVEEKKFVPELRDSLLSADEPYELVKGAFELLGHTGNVYVSDIDKVDCKKWASGIKAGDEEKAQLLTCLVQELGLEKVLKTDDLFSTFLGIQIGLESNRRKNVGGKYFKIKVEQLLNGVVRNLRSRGCDVDLKDEKRIYYKSGGDHKSVDFALYRGRQPALGIEVNFYTTSGSKPTEIKRSYADVNRRLREVGVELVWITDGDGYFKMKRSLEEAFRTHPNIYNFRMAQKLLEMDILRFLKQQDGSTRKL